MSNQQQEFPQADPVEPFTVQSTLDQHQISTEIQNIQKHHGEGQVNEAEIFNNMKEFQRKAQPEVPDEQSNQPHETGRFHVNNTQAEQDTLKDRVFPFVQTQMSGNVENQFNNQSFVEGVENEETFGQIVLSSLDQAQFQFNQAQGPPQIAKGQPTQQANPKQTQPKAVPTSNPPTAEASKSQKPRPPHPEKKPAPKIEQTLVSEFKNPDQVYATQPASATQSKEVKASDMEQTGSQKLGSHGAKVETGREVDSVEFKSSTFHKQNSSKGASGIRGVEKGSKGAPSIQSGAIPAGTSSLVGEKDVRERSPSKREYQKQRSDSLTNFGERKFPTQVQEKKQSQFQVTSDQQSTTKPPLKTADNFFRARGPQAPVHQALAANSNLAAGNQQSVEIRQRSNSQNFTANHANIMKRVNIVSNGPGSVLGGGLISSSNHDQASVAHGGQQSHPNSREGGDRKIKIMSQAGNNPLIDSTKHADRMEVFSQQQQQKSLENFNSIYANRISNIQLSQGGGGGFAKGMGKGMIHMHNKEWKFGGMAASTTLGQVVQSNQLRNKIARGRSGGDRLYSMYKHTGTMLMDAKNQEGYYPGATQRSINQAPKSIAGYQEGKLMSDAGSRYSFATQKRGLPKSLWQKGAIFSTRQSRASVSAGKYVPQFNQGGYLGGNIGTFNHGNAPQSALPLQQQRSNNTQFPQDEGQSLEKQRPAEKAKSTSNFQISTAQRMRLPPQMNASSSQNLYQASKNNLSQFRLQGVEIEVDPYRPTHMYAMNPSKGNIELNQAAFRNRPFSSENKYGIMRRNQFSQYQGPNDYIHEEQNQSPQARDGIRSQLRNLQFGHQNTTHMADSYMKNQPFQFNADLEIENQGPALSEVKYGHLEPHPGGYHSSQKRHENNFLPPINLKQGQTDIKKLITEDIDNFDLDKNHLDVISRSGSGERMINGSGLHDPEFKGITPGGDFMPEEIYRVNSPKAHFLQTNYEKKEERMLSQRVPEIVWLRIYHVTSFNKYLLEWLGFGFYHTSIELYNHEFAYGGHEYEFSGIVCVPTVDESKDKQSPEESKQASAASGGLELKERLPIGVTYYSMDEIDDIVIYFGNFWHGKDYEPFARNCNHFAQNFIAHICDKEMFYYPSYINRFTKLGSMLRGWFKPLTALFGEVVDLDQNEEEKLNEWGYANAEDFPVPGVAQSRESIEPKPDQEVEKEKSERPIPKPNDILDEKPMLSRQVSMMTNNKLPANPVPDDLEHSKKPSRLFSPLDNPAGDKGESSQVDSRGQNQLSAILQLPNENIKVSEIIDMTQQKKPELFPQSSKKLNKQQSHLTQTYKDYSPEPAKDNNALEERSQHSKQAEDFFQQPRQNMINNVKDEPVENIKHRADQHFALQQFQQAMKFYEICLGKITAVTDVDLNEDQYMMYLTVQTYLGICDSAKQLNLPDHMIQFASECIKIDQYNTSLQIQQVLFRRAEAYFIKGKFDSVIEDLELALYMAQTSPDIDNQQEQIEFLKTELTQQKQKMKELQQKDAKASSKYEDKQPQDDDQKEAEESKFDQPEAIMDSPVKPPKEEHKHQNQRYRADGDKQDENDDQETQVNIQDLGMEREEALGKEGKQMDEEFLKKTLSPGGLTKNIRHIKQSPGDAYSAEQKRKKRKGKSQSILGVSPPTDVKKNGEDGLDLSLDHIGPAQDDTFIHGQVRDFSLYGKATTYNARLKSTNRAMPLLASDQKQIEQHQQKKRVISAREWTFANLNNSQVAPKPEEEEDNHTQEAKVDEQMIYDTEGNPEPAELPRVVPSDEEN